MLLLSNDSSELLDEQQYVLHVENKELPENHRTSLPGDCQGSKHPPRHSLQNISGSECAHVSCCHPREDHGIVQALCLILKIVARALLQNMEHKEEGLHGGMWPCRDYVTLPHCLLVHVHIYSAVHVDMS